MKILFNCYEYPPCRHGGVGTFYKDLAEGLVERGHQVTVVGIYYDNVLKLEKITEEEINGVKVIRIPQYKKTRFPRIDIFLSRVYFRNFLRRLFKSERFDIIESPEGSGWLPWGIPGNIPLVTRLHGGQGVFELMLNRKSSRIFKVFEKMQLRRSKFIVAVSDFISKSTSSVYGIRKDIHVLYNGVKMPSVDAYKRTRSDDEEVKGIIFYGSVDTKKGVKELLQAYIILVERGYNVKLSIAGKMTNKQYNEELFDLVPPSMQEKVVFFGSLDREKELFPLVVENDVCCFPSKIEAFGLAPVEAMAFGKPVVFTKLAAGPEVIRDGEDGLLCDPYNPEDIANKIAKFLDDDQLCKTCATSAYNRAWSEFTMEKMLENNLKYYQLCLNHNKE